MTDPRNTDWRIVVGLTALIRDVAEAVLYFADPVERPDRVIMRKVSLDKLEYGLKELQQKRRGTLYARESHRVKGGR